LNQSGNDISNINKKREDVQSFMAGSKHEIKDFQETTQENLYMHSAGALARSGQ